MQATGVVIAADGPSAAEVNSFSLRQADGVVLNFRINRLDLSNGGLPSAHLREHMASGEPITVDYHVENGLYIADRYTDAAEIETQQPSQQPTTTSGPGTLPPPTATATAVVTPPPTPTPEPTPVAPFHLGIEPFVDGFEALTFLTNAADFTGDLYAVEQRGVIWRIGADGTVDPTPFLDIHERVSCCGERGLLGLAFHPGYAENDRFFVNYTDNAGNTVVSEFGAPDDGYGDADSERRLLGINQPFPNHNGGMLAFGPDGYLYIGTGDGGSGGDPMGNGQDLTALLGKILRIDIDSGDPYGIPADNPFVGQIPEVPHRPEIWDRGMRNPWRFSFDRQTGDLWIGDVGQDIYEEVDAEPAGTGGRNYGWNTMEASHCFATPNCDQAGLTLSVAEYRHAQGCSITGGYVYRGSALPQLIGQYVFADYCSGRIWALDAATALSAGSAEPTQYGKVPINPTSFGQDEAGELYLVDGAGGIYRLIVE
ncbi:MAG TPA: PQQ-dependent sugar dehydrogenase [Candidatus Limnocylindrales bacterium]|jgi:glucose/arabinose dehydrogenase